MIGRPGDHVAIRNGSVIVNGYTLDETYIAAAPNYSGEWTVPPGQLFVLGDNRNDSSDSHAWGMVPFDNVIGKGILIYWPVSQWNMIDHIVPAAASN